MLRIYLILISALPTNDLYNVQNLNATILVHWDAIQALTSLEENILLGYNLYTDFFSHP